MELSILEQLVESDYGLVVQGERWAHSKEHDSLVIDREKQVFYFNSEDLVGDAFQYLIKVRKLPVQDAKEFLRHQNFTGTFISEIKDGNEVVTYPKLVQVFHQNLNEEARDYFHRRTITDETIDRYELGYYDGFVTIPIYQDGVFKQFQLRKDNPKVIRNYYKGVGGLLYNSGIMQLTNKIVITEGVTSCIVMNQNGIPSVSCNTGAGGFMPTWVRYFVHQKEIYLCFAKGTEIVTGNGIKPIETVTKDDVVFTHMGNVKPVTDTMVNSYTGKMYAFNSVGGGDQSRRFYMTGNHPLYVVRGDNTYRNNRGFQFENEPEWSSAEDVHQGDYFLEPTYNFHNVNFEVGSWDSKWVISKRDESGHIKGTKKLYIPTNLTEEPFVKDADFSYLIGLFLGDGHFRVNKTGVVGRFELAYHAKNKQFIMERVKSYFDRYGFRYTSYETGNIGTFYCYDWRLNFFSSFYKEIDGKRAKDPSVWLAFASNFNKEEMLKGLLDADGNINGRGQVSFTNTNRNIILLTEMLAGGTGRKYSTTGYKSSNPTWKYQQSVHFAESFRGKHKEHTYLVSYNDVMYIARKVTDVYTKDVVDELVYNLEVLDDHSYLLSSKVVAHNCYDNDQAGRLGAIRTAKILGEMRCKIFTFWDEEIQGYDCNDWFKDGRNKDDLLETVYTKSKYSFELVENSPQKRLTRKY